MCVHPCHIGTHTSFVFVCTMLFTYPWQVCCSTACVYALCWSMIKFPIEGFIIFSRQKRENYKPINPPVWSSSPLLPLCILPSLFYVFRPLFTRCSSGPPCLWCWEVICLYVRAVLSPACPIWLLQTLPAPHHHLDMWPSEVGSLVSLCFSPPFSLSLPLSLVVVNLEAKMLFWCLTEIMTIDWWINEHVQIKKFSPVQVTQMMSMCDYSSVKYL